MRQGHADVHFTDPALSVRPSYADAHAQRESPGAGRLIVMNEGVPMAMCFMIHAATRFQLPLNMVWAGQER